ncbi:MAG: hypothetical protein GSR79_01725 [Desulfurococcales archaeon]|nr:hypothetical protein [Desulfurococcales archaeon]
MRLSLTILLLVLGIILAVSGAMLIEITEASRSLSEYEKVYLALFLAAKHSLDYRLTAAMHIYMMRNRIALRPEILVKALRDARVVSKIPRATEEESHYVWEAVLYKGILYAQQLLSLDKQVIVEPSKDKHERERLRVLLEGKRVTVKGRTYHVGGLVKKLNGQRLAPWIYLLPKKNVPKLTMHVEQKARFTTLAP